MIMVWGETSVNHSTSHVQQAPLSVNDNHIVQFDPSPLQIWILFVDNKHLQQWKSRNMEEFNISLHNLSSAAELNLISLEKR